MPLNLIVHLVPSKDAFVSLPPSVVDQIFAANDSAASMVFRLDWKDADGAAKSACVSWMGGASGSGTQDIEIPVELGGCIGLGEGQQRRRQMELKKMHGELSGARLRDPDGSAT